MKTAIRVFNKIVQASLILLSAALDLIAAIACAPAYLQQFFLLLPFSPYYAFLKLAGDCFSLYKEKAQEYQKGYSSWLKEGRFTAFLGGLFDKVDSSAEFLNSYMKRPFQASQESMSVFRKTIDVACQNYEQFCDLWSALREPCLNSDDTPVFHCESHFVENSQPSDTDLLTFENEDEAASQRVQENVSEQPLKENQARDLRIDRAQARGRVFSPSLVVGEQVVLDNNDRRTNEKNLNETWKECKAAVLAEQKIIHGQNFDQVWNKIRSKSRVGVCNSKGFYHSPHGIARL